MRGDTQAGAHTHTYIHTAKTNITGPTKAQIVSVFTLSQQWSSALYLSTDTASVTPTIRTGSPEKQFNKRVHKLWLVLKQQHKQHVWRHIYRTMKAAASLFNALFSLFSSLNLFSLRRNIVHVYMEQEETPECRGAYSHTVLSSSCDITHTNRWIWEHEHQQLQDGFFLYMNWVKVAVKENMA